MLNNTFSKSPILVCVITGSRSEYGLMRFLMEDLKSASDFQLQVVATGSHLSEEHGLTYREIELDGFVLNALIPFQLKGADQLSLSEATGKLTYDLSKALMDLKPDLVMVMGDRYELLAVMASCVLCSIPIAHISGGEITEGAIDEQIRHAMTKVSHLHYVANRVYAARVRQMGEEDWRICVSGEPGLDNMIRQPLMGLDELQNDLGLDVSIPTALVTYHPVTLELDDLEWQLSELLAALEEASVIHGLQYVITYPNADTGFNRIVEAWQGFVNDRPGRVLLRSLGQARYLSALQSLSMMIGNSSSGLVEAPSFSLPVVNIGNRQKGRMRGTNVIDVGYERENILSGIAHALKWNRNEPCFNPYGDGHASEKVLAHLRHVFSTHSRPRILNKRFVDLPDVVASQDDYYAALGDC